MENLDINGTRGIRRRNEGSTQDITRMWSDEHSACLRRGEDTKSAFAKLAEPAPKRGTSDEQ